MINELKDQIKEIEKEQTKLANRKADLLLEVAGLECPFKVGDVGIINYCSYRNKKGTVLDIFSKYGRWYATVGVHKSNGELGKQTVEIYSGDQLKVERVK